MREKVTEASPNAAVNIGPYAGMPATREANVSRMLCSTAPGKVLPRISCSVTTGNSACSAMTEFTSLRISCSGH